MKSLSSFNKMAGGQQKAHALPIDKRSTLHKEMLENGKQLLRAGNTQDAVRLLKLVLKDVPDHVEANYVMAQIATKLGATRDAVGYVRRALKKGHGNYAIHYAMAEVCMKHGLAADALVHVDVALNLQPENQLAKTLKAAILQQLGKMNEAFELSRSVVRDNPVNDDAITVFATSAKFSGSEPEIELIERAYNANPEQKRQRYFGYAAGKIFNDAKQYDKAFAYFKKAADTYDMRNVRQLMIERTNLLRDVYSRDLILEKKSLGHASTKPIFIIGMPRSGTTLTEQILSSHPDVYGVGEQLALQRINTMISPNDPRGNEYKTKLHALKKNDVHSLANGYLTTLLEFSNKSKRYADKMPSNFFYVGLINILFPGSKIIHCTRDPIDNCLSCYTSPLDETHLYSKRLDVLGFYYREYWSLMEHWKKVSEIEIFDMPYEQTVSDLEPRARALIAHVGLPWNDACLKFNETNNQVATISKWQVRQPIYSTSVQRWKGYERHLGALVEALGDLAPDTDKMGP